MTAVSTDLVTSNDIVGINRNDIILNMRVFGLTGNFGSGKSTVAAMFRRAGIPVIDADLVSKKVMAPGERAYSNIVLELGSGILLPNGRIDRKKLGEIVFANPARRKRLEAATHPAILEIIEEYLEKLSKKGCRAAMIEAALIHETGIKEIFEKVICVRCDEETQLRRVMARDSISREEALSRFKTQMDAKLKALESDHVIDNSGNLDETRAQVERIAKNLTKSGDETA